MANPLKHKLKPVHLDPWSSREKLSLACSVVKNGDQNWVSVSRAIKPFAEGGSRPPDWFSQKNCALQYADLLEKVETPKKRGDKDINETPGEQIVRKLTMERLEELKKIITEEEIKYKKLKHEIDCIQSGQFDDRLPEMWENIVREKRATEEAAAIVCERRYEMSEAANKTPGTPGILKIKHIPLKQSRPPCSETSDEKSNDSTSHTMEISSPFESDNSNPVSSLPIVTTAAAPAVVTSVIPSVEVATPITTVATPEPLTPLPPPPPPQQPPQQQQQQQLHAQVQAQLQQQQLKLPQTQQVQQQFQHLLLQQQLRQQQQQQQQQLQQQQLQLQQQLQQQQKPKSTLPSSPLLSSLLQSKLKSADGLQQLKKEAELEHSAALQAYQHLQVSDAASVHSTHSLLSLSSTSSSSSSSPATSVLAPVDLPITMTTGSSGLTISLPSKPTPMPQQQQQQQQHIPTALPNIATLSSSAPPLQTLPSPVTLPTQLPAMVSLTIPKTLAAPAIVSTISPELSTGVNRLAQDITSPSTSAPTLSKLLGTPAQSKIHVVDPRNLLEIASVPELTQDKTELKIEDLISVREESTESVNTQTTENLSTPQECPEEKPTPLSNIQDEDTSSMGYQAKDLLDVDDEKVASVAASNSSKVETEDEETQQQAPMLSPKTELDEACAAAAFLETSSSPAASIPDSSSGIPTPLIEIKTDESSKHSLDETLQPEPEEVDSPAFILGNKFICVDDEISISIKDEPSSPSSSVSSKLSEPTSSAGRPRGRGRGRKKGGINRRSVKRQIIEDDKKEDGGSSKHSEAELTEDDSARESDDPANMMNMLAQSGLSSVLSDSIPNSPASLSHYSDTEDEKAYRTWKKSIMLVYREAATHKYANVFLHPVKEEIAPGYHSIVHRPMDLSAIKKNIETGVIRSTTEFQRDLMLMFTNAIMYNSSDHNVYSMAREMYDDVMQHIEQFVSTQLMVQTEVKMLRPSRRMESNEKEEETKKKKVDPSQDGGKKKKRPKTNPDEPVVEKPPA